MSRTLWLLAVLLLCASAWWWLRPSTEAAIQNGRLATHNAVVPQPSAGRTPVERESTSALSVPGSTGEAAASEAGDSGQFPRLSALESYYEQVWDEVATIEGLDDAMRAAQLRAVDLPEDERVESLAQDDLFVANVILNQLQSCDRVPRSREEANRIGAFGRRMAPSAMSVFFGDGMSGQGLATKWYSPEQQREDLAELEQQVEDCQWAWRLRDGGFRQQLYAMAESGNIAARYLYALWRPSGLDAPFDSTAYLQWKQNALRFSRQSLEEGREAGMITLWKSYAEGAFTETDRLLSTAFVIAHEQCNFPANFAVMERARLSVDRRGTKAARIEEIELATALADGLMHYCRD